MESLKKTNTNMERVQIINQQGKENYGFSFSLAAGSLSLSLSRVRPSLSLSKYGPIMDIHNMIYNTPLWMS